jgi:hypothetical protein
MTVPLASQKNIADNAERVRDQLGLGDSSTRDVGTTAGTIAAGDDYRIVAGGTSIQPSTLPTTVFAIYSGGFERSIVDRSKDFIVLNDLSDGSGSASNDDAAFQAALDLVASSTANNKIILLTRPFTVLSEKNLPPATNIQMAHASAYVYAQAAMRSIWNIDKAIYPLAGSDVDIRGVRIANRDANFAYAESAIRVNKAWNDEQVEISNLEGSSFTKVIDWVDGDKPMFNNITSRNSLDTLYFRNNGMNGIIQGVTSLGGRALYINKASGGQQMEGTKFIGINFIPLGPVNSQTPWGMEIHAGLRLGFHGLLVDQSSGAVGFMIDGTVNPVSEIDIFDLWEGGAENQSAGSFGMFVKGNVTQLNVYGGGLVANTGVGMQIDGQGSTITANLNGLRFRLNDLDMYANDAEVTINSCTFASDESISASATTVISGADNTFVSGGPALNGRFNLLRSKGAAAPAISIPTSPTGYPPGWFYTDLGFVKLT